MSILPYTDEEIAQRLKIIRSATEFQEMIMLPLLNLDLLLTAGRLTYSGLENLDPNEGYFFISNHTIIMHDAALIAKIWHKYSGKPIYGTVGENLYNRFTDPIFRLNHCIKVFRDSDDQDELKAKSMELSDILNDLVETQESVWLSQSKGRRKDGDYRTDKNIIQMLRLGTQDIDHLAEHIVPVSVSYEWDPNDKHKAQELHLKKLNGTYQKGKREDMKTIFREWTKYKGNIHVHFGKPLSGTYRSALSIALAVDESIHKSFHLFPSHQQAYDALSGSCIDYSKLNQSWKNRLAKIPEYLHEGVLLLYANPVRNKN